MPEMIMQSQVFRFEQMASQVKDKIEPAEADVDRYVGLEHIDPESLKLRRWGETSEVESSKILFRSGDIIFGKRRAYQRKLAVADFDGICSAHAMVLRPKTDVVVEEFLPFFMQSDTFMDRAVKISVGGLSPTINWRDLAKEEFALPTREAQRRIAELLRAAADVSETLLSLRRSAEALLRSAVDSAANRAVDRQSVVPLAALVDPERPICYGILMPGTGFEGGVPVVKVKDFPEGDIIVDGLLLTDPKIDEEYKRSRLRTDDLLISIRGTIGRLAFVPMSLDGANITQDTARLSIRPEHDSRFVRAVLESTFVQRQIVAFTTGLAVKGINIGELRRIQIPIASLKEQQEVVQEVVAVRVATQEIDKRLAQSEKVRKALLAEYIGGSR
ncbi:MAG TPA: restriction endonuclease subunit S [Actinobacteria bacterium]|nr:restriction endonuclease subunit S [Actinomycetota bacterium]